MSQALRFILGDQLSPSISALADADPAQDVILLAEVMEEATYVPHHKKKIAFLFSAMRHFAEELRALGFNVRYTKLDAAENTGSVDGEVARAAREVGAKQIIVTEPGEWRVREKFRSWKSQLKVPVEIRADDRFFCPLAQFRQWAGERKQLRMEFFYRDMRRQHGFLMEGDGTPSGGEWNYDSLNRKGPPAGLRFLPRPSRAADGITQEVLSLVGERFAGNFGDLLPFDLPVTREEALRDLAYFIEKHLPNFGRYQDDMLAGEPFLAHAHISAALNAGLLLPREVCEHAEEAWRQEHVPLSAAEGFIRQVLGWREYVRGVYWLQMPDYAKRNFFQAKRPLPAFYWTAETDMRCLHEAVTHTRQHAYSHHIQRLMVTGNFALLAGLLPSSVCEWYLLVYADAYEWVELPNVLGMALHGDGGLMGSKPYAASGKYINRMSNFCSRCRFDPEQMTGPEACPFNALYWDFFARNRAKLEKNIRVRNTYGTWDRMKPERKEAILRQASTFLQQLH